jgi:hypothetical protein
MVEFSRESSIPRFPIGVVLSQMVSRTRFSCRYAGGLETGDLCAVNHNHFHKRESLDADEGCAGFVEYNQCLYWARGAEFESQ